MRVLIGAAYIGTIFAANWALQTFGVVPLFGLMMPAGVFFAGLAFGLRDVLHEQSGARWVIAAIGVGTVASVLVSPTFAVASGTAFLFSEAADFAVYAPFRKRAWVAAVIASNIVGSIVDSALFLSLAFGNLDFLPGQLVGKWLMVLPCVVLMWAYRRAR